MKLGLPRIRHMKNKSPCVLSLLVFEHESEASSFFFLCAVQGWGELNIMRSLFLCDCAR